MNTLQVRALLKIAEEALSKAQAVFADDFQPDESDSLTDQQRWARLLSHFEIAPNHALTVDQVRHAARSAGYDPRGLGALYNPRTNWLRSEGDRRVMTDTALEWFTTEGRKHLGGYTPLNAEMKGAGDEAS